MASYFNACDVTAANSNHKICYNCFSTCPCAPHFEKGSATHARGVQPFAIAGRITFIYMKYGHP